MGHHDHRRLTRAAKAASLHASQGSWIKFSTFRLSRYVWQVSWSAGVRQLMSYIPLTFGQGQLRAFLCA